ncbi:MAG: pre-peptidase C-terminal domain-containing protein [Bacteroidota bacterium]
MLSIPTSNFAQISLAEQPHAQRYQDLITSNVPTVQMPAVDLNQLQQEDAADEAAGLPPRFGKRFNVSLNPNDHGRWDNVPNGGRVWRLAIESAGAISLNLTFDDFFLPKGARLFIFTEDFSQILGAFSAENNKADGKFATSLVFDEKVIIGYYEPRGTIGQGRLSVDGVIHGYREIPAPELDKFQFNRLPPSGLNCFIDAACPEGDPWRDQIKSVGLAIVAGGTRWCSGALVANTSGDQRLLFLTANSCLYDVNNFNTKYDAISNSSLSTWVFEWNYEATTCEGSVPSMTNSTTGATVLANSSPNAPDVDGSDFALLELTESPIAAGYDVFFAGWDKSGAIPQGGTSIHHPNGAPKKIAIENAPLVASTSNPITGGTSTDLTHWEVTDWDGGALEGSSQGAVLFENTNGRIVGQFSGGFAGCNFTPTDTTDNGQPDYFGQLAYSWNNNGATDARRRLRDWLDPLNTGQAALNGYFVTNSCANPEIVGCDATFNGNTANGSNVFEDYGLPNDYFGKEIIHSFTPNTTGLTIVDLTNLNADLDLFLLFDCNPNFVVGNSTNLGTNSESITANLIAGATYYILVDAKGANVESTYTISTGCMDPCEAPIAINCGDVVSGTTFGMSNYYSEHGNGGSGWLGGEVVYEFTTVGGVTDISLTGLTEDLDLFLLDDCDPVNNEIASSTSIGLTNESININLNAGTYFIMIDGFGSNNPGGNYTLDLDCPAEATCNNPFGVAGDLMYVGNTSTGQNNITQYGAFGGYSGNELVYAYTPDEDGPFDISLTGLSADLDLFLLSTNCDPINALIASSTQSNLDDEFISADLVSGVTYYIIVDAFGGVSGSFDLFIETPTACDLPPQLDCAPLTGFVFGVSGSTIAADNDYLFHGGNTTDEYRGGEAVYEFSTEAGTVEIELTSLANNLDLFLLEVCDSVQNEIARSDFGGKSNEIITTTVAAGTYFIMIDGLEDAESNFSLTLRCNRPPILVRTKIFIEGAYDSSDGKMTDELRDRLGTTEPFTALGFNHSGGGGGETINPMILTTTGDDAIMDWVFVELRDGGDSDFVVATRSALLQRDGDVVDLDGESPLEFPEIRDNYYIAVKMRNHLGVMTDMPVSLNYD